VSRIIHQNSLIPWTASKEIGLIRFLTFARLAKKEILQNVISIIVCLYVGFASVLIKCDFDRSSEKVAV